MTDVVDIARQLKQFGGKSREGRADKLKWKAKAKLKYKGKSRKKRSDIVEEDLENIEVLMKNYLENSNEETANEILMSNAAWNPGQLVGPVFDKWVPYSAMLTWSIPGDDGIKDFAFFMYCMLNHP